MGDKIGTEITIPRIVTPEGKGKETEVPSGYGSIVEEIDDEIYNPINIPPSYQRLNRLGVLRCSSNL